MGVCTTLEERDGESGNLRAKLKSDIAKSESCGSEQNQMEQPFLPSLASVIQNVWGPSLGSTNAFSAQNVYTPQ